ncbi:hypothetical protein Tco_1079043 [Tanacetum coccineum]|uniref:Uncharacterized protein n=1 Tax=Tanacetum coccineum TaxID=301880 RepID=A0ABQ5HQP8_9ASTR
MNKLVNHGLVNGLPSKLFTNDYNCVACNKGKQHKASYKASTAVSTIFEPLQLLHMDLFSPTSIRSIDHKYTTFQSNHPSGTQDTNTNAGPQDDSDSESDDQLIVVPSFPTNHFLGLEVNPASATVESTSDYAEELARLQRQEYEANTAAKDAWHAADTAPAVSAIPPTSIPAGSINQAAGVSAVPSTPSSSNGLNLVQANDTPLPPEMEGIHHHPTTGIFSESSYDADFGGSITNLAPHIDVDPTPTRRVHTVHPISQIIGDLSSPVLTRGSLKKSNVCTALNDPDWVEAMHEEMQQFVNQAVWKLVPLPEGKTAIRTK